VVGVGARDVAAAVEDEGVFAVDDWTGDVAAGGGEELTADCFATPCPDVEVLHAAKPSPATIIATAGARRRGMLTTPDCAKKVAGLS